MIFTPTTNWNSFSNAASKNLIWDAYVKSSASLSASVAATAGWTGVTSYISKVPDITTAIEYDIGQFTSNAIDIQGTDVSYWKNIFNVPTSSYLEFKLEVKLAFGQLTATDQVIPFAGYVDKQSIQYNELSNSINFSVYTPQDAGDRIPAENIVTQYIDPDCFADNTGISGIVVNNTVGLAAVTANLPSYFLKTGVHTITYTKSSGLISLDSGSAVPLAAPYTTIGDGESPSVDAQRLKLAVLFNTDVLNMDDFTDYVIVLNSGSTIPFQWYRNTSAKTVLSKIFDKMGVTGNDVTYDSMFMNSFSGDKKITYLDLPPLNPAINGHKYALTSDGTNLWLGIGNKLYKRAINDTANPYTSVTSLSANTVISKLFYNARNNHIWAYHAGNTGPHYFTRYDIGGASSSSAVRVSTQNGGLWFNSMELVDYNYTGASYKYGILFTDSLSTAQGTLLFLNGTTLSAEKLWFGSTLSGTKTIVSNFMHPLTGGRYRYQITEAGDSYYEEALVTSGGTWQDTGVQLGGNLIEAAYRYGVYHPTEKRIYFDNTLIQSSHTTDNASFTDFLNANMSTENYYSATDGKVYFTATSGGKYFLFSVTGNVKAQLSTSLSSSHQASVYTRYQTMVMLNGILYGINKQGLLWQYNNQLSFYIPQANYQGMSVFGALNKTLQAFNLLGTINPVKKAYVYRRANDSGTPQTTGYSISANIANVRDITQDFSKFAAINFISVSNTFDTVTYDGTTFGVNVLSDTRQLSISNDLIPTDLLEDICYYTYQFFKTGRVIYNLPIVNPYFQYEPFDGAQLALTTTTITAATNGLLYKVIKRMNGTMNIEALI